MKEKDIKRLIRKQIKLNHPGWKSLPKKEKKRIAKEITDGVIREYVDNCENVPVEELVGIEGQSLEGIINI